MVALDGITEIVLRSDQRSIELDTPGTLPIIHGRTKAYRPARALVMLCFDHHDVDDA